MATALLLAAGAVCAYKVASHCYDKLRAAVRAAGGPTAVPDAVVATVIAVREHAATPAQVRAAAAQAAHAGHLRLGQALADEAAALERVREFVATVAHTPLGDAITYLSPLPGVTAEEWTTYVRRSRMARPNAVTPRYQLGAYQLSARELDDVGLMRNAHKGEHDGRKGIWVGEWVEGESEAAFLGNPAAQYQAVVKLTQLHVRFVNAEHASAIGTAIEGETATLSGLLGVIRRAGRRGLGGWIGSAKQRHEFPQTTAAYRQFNGIF